MPNLGYKNTDDAQRMGNEVRHRRKRVKPGQHEVETERTGKYGIIYGCFRTYFSPNYFCGKNNDKNMKLNCIKEVLEDKGISQTWLSKKLGKSFSTVNSYACNRSQPNLNTLLEISKLLAVNLKD